MTKKKLLKSGRVHERCTCLFKFWWKHETRMDIIWARCFVSIRECLFLLSYSLVHQYEVFELENNYHPKLNEYIQLFFPMSAHICRVMFLTNRTPWTCFCMFFRNMGGGSGNNVASKQGIHHGHGFPSSLQVSASKVMAEEHIKRIQRKWDVHQREKIMRPGQWTANGCKWVIPPVIYGVSPLLMGDYNQLHGS